MTFGKHLWLVPLLLALLIGGAGWWADQQLRRTIEQELRADLQSTLEANVTALEIWMANQKRMASALTEEPHFKTLALELLDQPASATTNRMAMLEISRQLNSTERLPERVRHVRSGMVPPRFTHPAGAVPMNGHR